MASLRLLALLCLSALTAPLFAAPVNDNIADAIVLSDETGVLDGTLLDATSEPGEDTLGGRRTESVWFKHTPAATGYMGFKMTDEAASIYIQVYPGGAGTPTVAALDGPIHSAPNHAAFAVKAGQPIFLKVTRMQSMIAHTFRIEWEFQNGGIISLEQGILAYFQEEEGTRSYGVRRGGASLPTTVRVHYSILHGTTTAADVEFVSSGTLVFPPYSSSEFISLTIHADDLVEGPERFTVRIDGIEGAILYGDSSAVCTIADRNDDPPNDLRSEAIALPGTFGTVSGTLIGADVDWLGNDVFYTWTAPVSETAQFTVRGGATAFYAWEASFYDRVLVFVGTTDPSDPTVHRGSFAAVAGRTYTFVIGDLNDGLSGPFSLTYDMDQDGDTLADSREASIGTDPADIDSDDDGVTDDAELLPTADTDEDGLVNAMDPDSDGDGLFDGTEMGITTRSEGTRSEAGFFIPDHDSGATRTDVLVADTDSGGAHDGYEDTNRNGALEEGEADPHNSLDDPIGQIRIRETTYSGLEGSAIAVAIDRVGNGRGAASITFRTSLLTGRAAADLQDFVEQTVQIAFADGELGTRTINVPLLDDSLFEDAEGFRAFLSEPENAVLAGGNEAILTISNTDPYTGAAGSYGGTFGPLNNVAGAFNLRLAANRRFTGTLTYQHSRYPLRGRFGNDGTATLIVKRKGLAPLQVDLRVTGGGAFVQGAVREGTSETGYELAGGRAAFSSSNPALPGNLKSQKLTILLQPGEGTPAHYEGTGHAVGTLTSAGNLRVVGVLPDGSSFSAAGAMDANRSVSVQQVLYRGFGGLYGALTVATAGTSVEGELGWIRTPNPNKPEGFFSARINARGFAYVKPSRGEPILPQLDETEGAIAFLFTPNGGVAPLRLVGALASNHRLTDSNVPPMELKGSANPATGLLRGSFQGAGASKFSFSGVFVQETGTFEGLSTWAGSTGRVTSEPLLQGQ